MAKSTVMETANVATPWQGRSNLIYRVRSVLQRVLVYVLLAAGAILFLVPFVWMLSTSFKEGPQVYTWPPVWIPHPFRFDNYLKAWTILPFVQFYWNTTRITVL